MTRETLPDFSGVYADERELRERVQEQGFAAVCGCRLFGCQVLHIEAEDAHQRGVYLIEHLPGGRVYLTDGRIGYNECRFAKELKELRGGAR